MAVLMLKIAVVLIVGFTLQWFIPLFQELDRDLFSRRLNYTIYKIKRDYLTTGVAIVAFLGCLALCV